MRRLPSKLGFRWLSHQIVIEFYHLPVVTHIDKIVGLYNSIGPRPHYPLGGGEILPFALQPAHCSGNQTHQSCDVVMQCTALVQSSLEASGLNLRSRGDF